MCFFAPACPAPTPANSNIEPFECDHMEISSIKAGSEPSDAAAMVVQLSEQQRDELELLYAQCPRPTSAHLHDFIKDRPTLAPLDKHCLKAWFHNRRLKEKRDEHLSPLIHKNAELKAEQQSLLLRNSQLRSQTLLLNLENQRLKEQLEKQLQKRQSAASSSASSLAIEDISSDSDIEEPLACGLETGLSKVKLGWTSDDSCSS